MKAITINESLNENKEHNLHFYRALFKQYGEAFMLEMMKAGIDTEDAKKILEKVIEDIYQNWV